MAIQFFKTLLSPLHRLSRWGVLAFLGVSFVGLITLRFLYENSAPDYIYYLVALFFVIILILTLYFTLRRRIKIDRVFSILEDDTIVAISDVHLGHKENYEWCEDKLFLGFLQQLRPTNNYKEAAGQIKCDHLVINGDFLEMWRRNLLSVILESYLAFESLKNCLKHEIKVYFIVGNHDYYLRTCHWKHDAEANLKSGEESSIRFLRGIELRNENERFVFLHGDEFDDKMVEKVYDFFCLSDDFVGDKYDKIWQFIKFVQREGKGFFNKLSLIVVACAWKLKMWRGWNPRKWFKKTERRRKKIYNPASKRFSHNVYQKLEEGARENPEKTIPSDFVEKKAFAEAKHRKAVLVFGHTHHPFVWQGSAPGKVQVANTGSWVKEKEKSNFAPTFVQITKIEGKPQLKLCEIDWDQKTFLPDEKIPKITYIESDRRENGLIFPSWARLKIDQRTASPENN